MEKVLNLICFVCIFGSAFGSITPRQEPGVVVSIASGTFKGNLTAGIDGFYGMPYAESPTGDRRLRPPAPLTQKFPNFDATRPPPICTQHGNPADKLTSSLPIHILPGSPIGVEDCLTLDILRPHGVKKGDKLPVFFWIFGGGFSFGSSSQNHGNKLVEKSVAMKKPIIFVAINHRLNMFGFLGGKEVAAEGVGNLGLLDQRMALEWVQANIEAFGGDPEKVTVAGVSAGGMSVVHHMMAKNGNNDGLFRGAIAESGSPISTGRLVDGSGQLTYDAIVKFAGCAGTPNTLQCLRTAPYQKLIDALKKVPESVPGSPFILSFFPRIDGKFVTNDLESGMSAGKVAKVALITGDTDDEGTGLALLSGGTLNLPRDLRDSIKHLLPAITPAQLEELLQLYHYTDVTQGSPFNTGFMNTMSPFYKQFSAILGDVVFQAPRRLVSRSTQALMPTYGYIDRGGKSLPVLGSAHAYELAAVFGKIPGSPRANDYQSRWISFTNSLDPNAPGLPRWEPYGKGEILQFNDLGSTGTIPDKFREDEMNYVIKNIESLRIIAP